MLKKQDKNTTGIKYTSKGSITAKRPIHIAMDLSYNYGDDVVVYDVKNKTPFVNYYIVCSCSNEAKMRKVISVAEESLYDNYKEIDHKEGKNNSKWVLIDAKDIVIQIFLKEERNRVQFDKLYEDCPHKVVVSDKQPIYRRRKKKNANI